VLGGPVVVGGPVVLGGPVVVLLIDLLRLYMIMPIIIPTISKNRNIPPPISKTFCDLVLGIFRFLDDIIYNNQILKLFSIFSK